MTLTTKRFALNDQDSIPAVGFGTYLIDSKDAARAVSDAITVGYRHIDTAEIYENEAAVGEGIRAGLEAAGLAREDLFVTTKVWPGGPGLGLPAKGRAETSATFDASLSKLGLDYVDLYLIHSPHAGAKRLEQWETLLELKRGGRARSVGVSNFGEAHLEEIKAAGLATPAANQIEIHPWSQKPQLVAYLRAAGILPIAYSSLAPLSTWRSAPGQGRGKRDGMADDGGAFAALAAKYGVTEAQLLLRWGVQSRFAILPKSLRIERMRQNLDLDGFSIDEADMARLRAMDRGDGLAWGSGDPTRAA